MSDHLRPFICELRALAKATGSLPLMLEFNSVAQDILLRTIGLEARRCAAFVRKLGGPDGCMIPNADYFARKLLESAGLEPEEAVPVARCPSVGSTCPCCLEGKVVHDICWTDQNCCERCGYVWRRPEGEPDAKP